MTIDYMLISVTYVQMCKTQINICLLYIALVVISHHFILLNFHIFWINHWQGNSFLFNFEKTLNFRQFELKQSQYEVGDFVLIASSNDDFQEDPLESAYVARLDDLYSDGIFMMIFSSFSTLFTRHSIKRILFFKTLASKLRICDDTPSNSFIVNEDFFLFVCII